MSPSSPSNAESPGPAGYRVSTRAVSADFAAARPEESARDLGSVDAATLIGLLEKLLAFDPAQVADADPHLVVSARRGRFFIRPGSGRLVLRSATDSGQNYCELPPAEVPDFLNGLEMSGPAPGTTGDSPAVDRPGRSRLALALSLFAAAALAVAGSAWLTFRPDELDPASLYGPIREPADTARLRQDAVGTYVCGTADDERHLEIAADGTVRYREFGPGRDLVAERAGPASPACRVSDRALVLRVPELGTIEVKGPDTLVFARDTYQRRHPSGAGKP